MAAVLGVGRAMQIDTFLVIRQIRTVRTRCASTSSALLGSSPGFSNPEAIAVVGDSLVITDSYAVLTLRHALSAH
jgi:hypothetical protein